MHRATAAYLRALRVEVTVADDAVANVIRRLLEHGLPRDVADGNWEAYLVRAAINAAKDEIKKGARRVDQLAGAGDVSVVFEHEADPVSMEEQVVAAIDTHRLIARVREAIAGLPPAQQRAVIGTFLHGRTNNQVAADLGVSAARVSQLKSAGIRTLGQTLAGLPR
jgi:RNA polymerase sigma-70 factor (ECF subfamily)